MIVARDVRSRPARRASRSASLTEAPFSRSASSPPLDLEDPGEPWQVRPDLVDRLQVVIGLDEDRGWLRSPTGSTGPARPTRSRRSGRRPHPRPTSRSRRVSTRSVRDMRPTQAAGLDALRDEALGHRGDVGRELGPGHVRPHAGTGLPEKAVSPAFSAALRTGRSARLPSVVTGASGATMFSFTVTPVAGRLGWLNHTDRKGALHLRSRLRRARRHLGSWWPGRPHRHPCIRATSCDRDRPVIGPDGL